MQVTTFDPGAVATGLATIDNEGKPWWNQLDDPVRAYKTFTRWATPDDIVLVEDYSHGGAFTREAKLTVEIVGFIYYTATLDGYKVLRRNKDKRLSGQGEAARFMGDEVSVLKKDKNRKDAFSALSHCVVYRREEM